MVTVRSALGTPFQGVMLQARTPDRRLVGTFEPETDAIHTIDCSGTGDTITHSNTQSKPSLEVHWKTNGYEGPLVFNATVAQDYSTFWTGIQSQQLTISKRDAASSDPAVAQPRPGSAGASTPSYFNPQDDSKSQSATDFDPFYDGCDTKKTCFGAPANCVRTKNCKAVVAITVYGDRYEFELKALAPAVWVGVGLSDDSQMGDDSVLECARSTGSGAVQAFLSYTTPRPNLNVIREKRPQEGIQLLSSTVDNGNMYCRVVRDVKTTSNGKEIDLVKNSYNLLIAAGSSVNPNKVSFHDIAYVASNQRQFLSVVGVVGAASKLLLRLHGAFMIAAWIGTASLGILLARYYKQTWVGRQIMGKDLWFTWHRTFMVLTWLLTMTGFILIFVELKAWSTERNPHAILGICTTILCFIQPIMAFFRPHPGTPRRPVFNWLHWLVGNCAHIIGIVAIFFAVMLNKAELPEWMEYVLVAYVAFHVLIHLILQISACISDKSAERRVNAFQMKEMGSRSSSAFTDRSADAPLAGLRKFLLALYIIGIIVLVVALILIVVLAPIEETWNDWINKVQS